MKKIIVFSFLTLLLFSSFYAHNYTVSRGERPFIDIYQIPDSGIVSGIVRIKFIKYYQDHLSQLDFSSEQDQPVLFNLEKLDETLSNFGVSKIEPFFQSKSFNGRYEERHRAWGFHLWFELTFPLESDIRRIVTELREIPEIDWAEPEYTKILVSEQDLVKSSFREWIPSDPQFSNQWHYHNTGQAGGTPGSDIKLPLAWEIEKGSPDVIVAILDTGIQLNHPDLQAHIWEETGFNFVNNSPNITAGDHGTHVAGTVSAVNNNDIGVSGIAGGSGLADGVRLMACQVFSGSSSGGFHIAPVYAADNGAAISQNSWGYTTPNSYEQVVLDAIDYFNTHGGGEAMLNGITIFASGNSNSSSAYYPGYYSGAFSVSATNNNDIRASYSNYGNWVDISAPGGQTSPNTAGGVLSTTTNNGYSYYQGTSMACPHVSGVVALMISKAYGEMSSDDVKNILISTTDNIDHLNPNFTGQLGTGRLNALNALMATEDFLNGIINPYNFTAETLSSSQVLLTWDNSSTENLVLLAWSPSNQFGTPEPGLSYSEGELLEGGGFILYEGGSNMFIHSELDPATYYYYKIWTFNDEFYYSFGTQTQTFTFCEDFFLPFSEDFNNTPPAPLCWENIGTSSSNHQWQFGTFSGGLTGTEGNYAYFNSAAYGLFSSQNSSLITPPINTTGYDTVNLSFTHYYHHRSSWLFNSIATLYYSIDNGENWIQLEQWQQSTENPADYFISLTEVAGHTAVRFRWNYQGNNAFSWSIDDVMVTGESILDISQDSLELMLFNTDQEFSYPLTLFNSSHNPLTISTEINYLSPDGIVNYILPFPDEVEILPWEETIINITVSAEILESGFYEAEILFNDPTGLSARVPLSLNILEPEEEMVGLLTEIEFVNNLYLNWEPLPENPDNLGHIIISVNNETVTEIEDLTISEYYLEGLNQGDYLVSLELVLNSIAGQYTEAEIYIHLKTPYNLDAVSEDSNISIFWQSPEDAINITSFKIYRDEEFIAETVEPEYLDEVLPTGIYNYLVSAIYNDDYESGYSEPLIVQHVSNTPEEVLTITGLAQNYPNPFNPSTVIQYSISEDTSVDISIYTLRGRKVTTLVNEYLKAGNYSLRWNGEDQHGKRLSSGIYFYRMKTDTQIFTKKLMLLK